MDNVSLVIKILILKTQDSIIELSNFVLLAECKMKNQIPMCGDSNCQKIVSSSLDPICLTPRYHCKHSCFCKPGYEYSFKECCVPIEITPGYYMKRDIGLINISEWNRESGWSNFFSCSLAGSGNIHKTSFMFSWTDDDVNLSILKARSRERALIRVTSIQKLLLSQRNKILICDRKYKFFCFDLAHIETLIKIAKSSMSKLRDQSSIVGNAAWKLLLRENSHQFGSFLGICFCHMPKTHHFAFRNKNFSPEDVYSKEIQFQL